MQTKRTGIGVNVHKWPRILECQCKRKKNPADKDTLITFRKSSRKVNNLLGQGPASHEDKELKKFYQFTFSQIISKYGGNKKF